MSLNGFVGRRTLLVSLIELWYCSLALEDWFGMLSGLGDGMIKDCFARKGSFLRMILRVVCAQVSECVCE